MTIHIPNNIYFKKIYRIVYICNYYLYIINYYVLPYSTYFNGFTERKKHILVVWDVFEKLVRKKGVIEFIIVDRNVYY